MIVTIRPELPQTTWKPTAAVVCCCQSADRIRSTSALGHTEKHEAELQPA